jgi:nucleotide-binding universal stress UspA family protein
MRGRSIVCGVDFSNASAKALKSAAKIAKTHGRRLVVLFVEDPLLAAAARAARDTRASVISTTAALERFIARSLGSRPTPRAHPALAIGSPADEILKVARRQHADLVVLGTRGMGRAARVLLGSTADAVLRRARIPVLAVPS